MAHKIIHAHSISIELDEKMMQTLDFTNTDYAANFQQNIFQCSKKTSRPISF